MSVCVTLFDLSQSGETNSPLQSGDGGGERAEQKFQTCLLGAAFTTAATYKVYITQKIHKEPIHIAQKTHCVSTTKMLMFFREIIADVDIVLGLLPTFRRCMRPSSSGSKCLAPISTLSLAPFLNRTLRNHSELTNLLPQ
jgi:hypothetical protein